MKTNLGTSLFFLAVLFFCNVQGMNFRNNTKQIVSFSRINSDKSLDLMDHAKKFLEKHHEKVIYQKNESGFVRVNIPINDNDIEKIRLNYWPASTIGIEEESIHNHPRYFESIIIQGGYEHQLYNKCMDKKHSAYNHYKILKNLNDEKKFMFVGQAGLQATEIQSIKKGSIVTFPKSMIHRVLWTKPSTLSLNVVFKDNNIQHDYDVYISPKGSFDDVKLTREILIQDETTQLTTEIIQAIQNFTDADFNRF